MASHEHSLETTATSERVWQVWSDTSTWKDWNPNVSEMDMDGPFAVGTTGRMHTRAGTYYEPSRLGRSVDICRLNRHLQWAVHRHLYNGRAEPDPRRLSGQVGRLLQRTGTDVSRT